MEKIRLAKKNEVEDVYSLFLRVKKQMETEGNFTWSNGYPDKEIFVKDCASYKLFVFVKDDVIIGSAATTDGVASYFFPSSLDEKKTQRLLNFSHCDNGRSSYVLERFMIDPKLQKRGEGGRFLSLIHKKEKARNCLLSVFSDNKKAAAFYQSKGFLMCGDCKDAEWGIDGSTCLLLSKPFIYED